MEKISKKVGLLGNSHTRHFQRFSKLYRDNNIDFAILSEKENIYDFKDYIRLPFSGRFKYILNGLWLRWMILSGRLKLNLLNAHYASGYGLTATLSGHRNILLNLWGSDVLLFPKRSLFHKFIFCLNVKSARGISSTSLNMIDEMLSCCGGGRKVLGLNVFHTPFGVSDIFFFDRTKKWAEKNGKICAGIVKSLEDVYGHDLLLKAYFLARQQISISHPLIETELHIVGDGPLREPLTELAKSLGLESHVIFHGELKSSEVASLLRSIDIFVSPSRSESFGVASLEAAASGLPLILTETKGSVEIFEKLGGALLVPPDNVAALKSALIALFIDEASRMQLGTVAQRIWKRHYLESDCNRKILSALKSCL